jgi:hypothetical protein
MRDRRRRLSAVVILSVVLMLCFAGSAFATTYCVGSAPNCTGTAEPDLQTALTEADLDTQGSDAIVLPAGTLSNANSFYYDGHVPLEIDGQGEGTTTLTLPSSSNVGYVLALAAGAASATLRGFSVVIAATNSNGITSQAPTTVSNVKVTASGSSADAGIALYDGGTASNVNVELPMVGSSAGLVADKTTTIDDSTLAATYGLEGTDATTVHRSVLIGGGDGVALSASGGSQGYVDDSLIEAHGSGVALFAYESTLIGRQLTVVGDADSTGVELTTGTNIGGAIRLSDSIIAEPFTDPFEIGGQAAGTITLDHSDYDHLDLPAGFVSGAGNLPAYVTPVFAHAANGDYRLMASSPASLFGLDASSVQSGESSTDLTALPRFNGAPRDLGAYQHQVPSVTAASATPQPAPPGAAVTFAAAAATGEPTDPLGFRWSFDDGGSATGASVTHAFATTGTHSATVTVTDALGFAATKTITVAVNAAAPAVLPTVKLGRASVSKKTDAITFAVIASTTGTASVRATFVRTLRKVSGKGRHRRIKLIHRTVLFATATAKGISAQGAATLKLSPSRSALRLLKALHKRVRVTVVVSFTPTGGVTQRHSLIVTLPASKAR